MGTKTVILFLGFLLSCLSSFAQEEDTVWVQGKSILILGDTSLFIDDDTVIVVPDNVARFLKQDTLQRNNRFYKDIKETLYKTKLTTELYHLLFDDNPNSPNKGGGPVNDNFSSYIDHIGKVINKVKITKLAVFGTDINDTTRYNNKSWILRKGNVIHNYTRSRVIKNHLFFSEGNLLDPIKLQDSERTLRSLPYIKDAKIIIEPIDDDYVNIVVIVKDNWSIYPALGFTGFSKWRLIVVEENVLGIGHELSNTIIHDKRDDPSYGYQGVYRIRNIGHSFVTAELSFAESHDFTTRGIKIFRNFVTPDIELAGGVEVSFNGYNIIRVLPDTLIDFDSKFQYQDVYLLRAYPVGSIEKRKRLVTGARFINYDFINQPEVSPDSNYQYFDRNQYLFSVGISKRSYEESSLIYGYGRTEDIPEGYYFTLTGGKEYSQFYNRWYLEFDHAIGSFIGRLGYLRPSFAIGGFINKGRIEQGIVRTDITYFSNLYYANRFAFRQFFYLNYTFGFRRFGNEFIDINNRNGIRGLSSVELLGTKRLSLRAETLAFTPFYLIGFRMAIFGFVDLGTVQPAHGHLTNSTIYQGYGIGFRLRNEDLAFKSISVRLGYYPNAPADAAMYNTMLGGQEIYNTRDFIIGPPSIITFN